MGEVPRRPEPHGIRNQGPDDTSALHPFVGKGKSTQWGTYKPRKLKDSVNGKNWIYSAFHGKQNMQFVQLVGTTLGRLGADAVAMSWGLAHRAA
eukprot:1167546-Rhodomonas_salina.1